MTDEELITRLVMAPLSCLDTVGWMTLRRLIDTAAERIDKFRQENLELQKECQKRFDRVQELQEMVWNLQQAIEGKQ